MIMTFCALFWPTDKTKAFLPRFNYGNKSGLSLSLVSKLWRGVAERNPQLWNTAVATVKSQDARSFNVLTYLDNAFTKIKSTTLSLKLNCIGENLDPRVDRLLQDRIANMLVLNAARLRTLLTKCNLNWRAISSAMAQNSSELRMLDWASTRHEPISLTPLLSSVNGLNVLKIRYRRDFNLLSLGAQWAQLTHLHLYVKTTVHCMLDVLMHCRDLEVCRLEWRIATTLALTPGTEWAIRDLLRLRELNIRSLEDISMIFDYINAPGLKTLRLFGAEHFEHPKNVVSAEALVTFVQRSKCKIDVLEFFFMAPDILSSLDCDVFVHVVDLKITTQALVGHVLRIMRSCRYVETCMVDISRDPIMEDDDTFVPDVVVQEVGLGSLKELRAFGTHRNVKLLKRML